MSQSGSQFYEGYWQSGKSWSPSGGTISPEEAALFQKHLKPGVVCLDYGCGDGTRYGKSLMEGGMTYRGFDISKTAVETARAAGVSVDLLGENGATGLADESCDVAICFELFEHLLEPNLALAEIFRVLKPGGHLLASVPNAAFWWTRLEFLATGISTREAHP